MAPGLVTPAVNEEVADPMLPCCAALSRSLGSGSFTFPRLVSWRTSVTPPRDPVRSIRLSMNLSRFRFGVQAFGLTPTAPQRCATFSNRIKSPKFSPTLASLDAWSISLAR